MGFRANRRNRQPPGPSVHAGPIWIGRSVLPAGFIANGKLCWQITWILIPQCCRVTFSAALSEWKLISLQGQSMIESSTSREKSWRLVGGLPLLLLAPLLYLWIVRPGELHTFHTSACDYFVRADFGRILVLRWSTQGGLNLLWQVPLWPFVLLSAIPPAWILWRFGPYRRPERRGFRSRSQLNRGDGRRQRARTPPPMHLTTVSASWTCC